MLTKTKECATNHIREELELVEYIHNKKRLFSTILGDTNNPFHISWWSICNLLQPNSPDNAALILVSAFSSMFDDNWEDDNFVNVYSALEDMPRLDVRDAQALAFACVELEGIG